MADCGVQFSEGQWCHRPVEHSGPHQDFVRIPMKGGVAGRGPVPDHAPPNAARRALGYGRIPEVTYVGPKPWRAALATYLRLWAERLEGPHRLSLGQKVQFSWPRCGAVIEQGARCGRRWSHKGPHAKLGTDDPIMEAGSS